MEQSWCSAVATTGCDGSGWLDGLPAKPGTHTVAVYLAQALILYTLIRSARSWSLSSLIAWICRLSTLSWLSWPMAIHFHSSEHLDYHLALGQQGVLGVVVVAIGQPSYLVLAQFLTHIETLFGVEAVLALDWVFVPL